MLVLGNWICKWAINVRKWKCQCVCDGSKEGVLVKVVVVEIARFISSRDRRAAGPVGRGDGGSSTLRLLADVAEWEMTVWP